jgi:hypothetical protein
MQQARLFPVCGEGITDHQLEVSEYKNVSGPIWANGDPYRMIGIEGKGSLTPMTASGSYCESRLLAEHGPKLTGRCWQYQSFDMPFRNDDKVPESVIQIRAIRLRAIRELARIAKIGAQRSPQAQPENESGCRGSAPARRRHLILNPKPPAPLRTAGGHRCRPGRLRSAVPDGASYRARCRRR